VKYCIIVPDGAADYPVPELGGKTPLQAARVPSMNRAARQGLLGVTQHVPPGMTPGSSVAMMSMFGYDPARCYTGRGPLEAADMGIAMEERDWAVRCNLVTVRDGLMADFSAGHVSTEEAAILLRDLNAALATPQVSFHVGTSYRHIMHYRGTASLDAETVAPHDMVGEPLAEKLPRGDGGQVLLDLMERSRHVLDGHEVNRARLKSGKNPANMVWLWGQGRRPQMQGFQDRFGLKGAVISAVNLVRGIGRLIGWDVIRVPGATGYLDTDYAAKGRYAVDALLSHDLVLVHIEAPDEAGHDRDVRGKVASLERIDRDIVGPMMAHPRLRGDLRLLIVPDHVTAVEDGKHKAGWVPFAIWGHGVATASGLPYAEAGAAAAGLKVQQGHDLMGRFLGDLTC
jgi:2,3-bisphosphoglycerate-independent phosphoglycerate mutase